MTSSIFNLGKTLDILSKRLTKKIDNEAGNKQGKNGDKDDKNSVEILKNTHTC